MKIISPIPINDAALLSTNVSETLYPPYDSGFSFAKGARCSVIGPDIHKVYESLVDGNIGNTPDSSPTKWVYVSVTNPRLMFDGSVTSQTTNPDSIDVSIQTTGRNPCLTLLNVLAAEVRVQMVDSVEGLVYDKTFSLVSDSGVDDWYSYFFEPVLRVQDLTVLDMPAYASSIVNVTMTAPGEIVKCGALLLGPPTDIGTTQYGATVGIKDYSVKQQDDFGNYTILQRAFSKRATFTVIIDAVRVDTLQQFLASLRAEPTIYIGSDMYASTAVYGFFKDFTIEIAMMEKSICSLEIEGLT